MSDNQPHYLKYHKGTVSQLDKAILPGDAWPDEWLRITYKGYPRFERLPLPAPQFSGSLPVHDVMRGRRTEREFSKERPITLEQISRVLSSIQVTDGQENPTQGAVRAYASAGGRYPIEAYLLPLNSAGLQKRLYHYHVRTHSLEKLWQFSEQQFNECFPGDSWCAEAGLAIILTACHARSRAKYGERAYRYCLLEAGQIAQNIQLLCASEGLGCCNYGAFVDDMLMHLLDVSPHEELVVHALFLGNRY